MASFDLGKLKELDEQLTKVLGDMQVCVVTWRNCMSLCQTGVGKGSVLSSR